MSDPKVYKQIRDKTQNFKRNDQESSRYFNIIKLTQFKKSYELDLKTPELLFDPIYDNMVFLMKFTIIICEKMKRFLKTKFKEQRIEQEERTTLFKLNLTDEERSIMKSMLYRVVFYINQVKNFMQISIQKNIITPKFYLLYTQENNGEFKTLREMQTNLNSIAITDFIKRNKPQLEFIDEYFRRNTMKFLTIRRFKRVFSDDYLKEAILEPMSYFKITPQVRNSICEFYYYYNAMADFFYTFQPMYISPAYLNMKQQKEGNGSTIYKVESKMLENNFRNVVRTTPRVPSTEELKELKNDLVRAKLGLGVRGFLIETLNLLYV